MIYRRVLFRVANVPAEGYAFTYAVDRSAVPYPSSVTVHTLLHIRPPLRLRRGL